MTDRKYAIVLTEGQSVHYLVLDATQEIFDHARRYIGCDWIEVINLTQDYSDYVMLIDEEGKLKGNRNINCIASHLYGSARHGDPVVGNCMIVRDAGEELELLTQDEATRLLFTLSALREQAVSQMRDAFHVRH